MTMILFPFFRAAFWVHHHGGAYYSILAMAALAPPS